MIRNPVMLAIRVHRVVADNCGKYGEVSSQQRAGGVAVVQRVTATLTCQKGREFYLIQLCQKWKSTTTVYLAYYLNLADSVTWWVIMLFLLMWSFRKWETSDVEYWHAGTVRGWWPCNPHMDFLLIQSAIKMNWELWDIILLKEISNIWRLIKQHVRYYHCQAENSHFVCYILLF